MPTEQPDRMTKAWWESLYNGATHTNQLLANDVRQLRSTVEALHRRLDDAMTQEVAAILGELRESISNIESRQDKIEEQYEKLIERLKTKFEGNS